MTQFNVLEKRQLYSSFLVPCNLVFISAVWNTFILKIGTFILTVTCLCQRAILRTEQREKMAEER